MLVFETLSHICTNNLVKLNATKRDKLPEDEVKFKRVFGYKTCTRCGLFELDYMWYLVKCYKASKTGIVLLCSRCYRS